MESTSINLLDFTELYDEISMNHFHYILPLSVKRVAPSPLPISGSQEEERVLMKQKHDAMVRDAELPQEWWLKDSKRWDTQEAHSASNTGLRECGMRTVSTRNRTHPLTLCRGIFRASEDKQVHDWSGMVMKSMRLVN